MNAVELIEKLSRHSVVRGNVAMQMQMGIPLLEKRAGKLCVSCLFYREELRESNVLFYAPRYQITWVHPFDKIIRFENLAFTQPAVTEAPVCSIPAQRYAECAGYIIGELYDKCSHVLSAYERDKDVTEVTLRNYRRACAEAVQELGLIKLYGEIDA